MVAMVFRVHVNTHISYDGGGANGHALRLGALPLPSIRIQGLLTIENNLTEPLYSENKGNPP